MWLPFQHFLEAFNTHTTVVPLLDDHPRERLPLVYDQFYLAPTKFVLHVTLFSDHPSNATSDHQSKLKVVMCPRLERPLSIACLHHCTNTSRYVQRKECHRNQPQYSSMCAYVSSRMLSRKCKILALHERIAGLDKIKEGRSCHSIAEDLGVSKTQIQGIVRNKKSIRQQWETGGRAERKYSKVRKLYYKDLDRVVWEWFTLERAKNFLISGRMVQERALMYSDQLGHSSF